MSSLLWQRSDKRHDQMNNLECHADIFETYPVGEKHEMALISRTVKSTLTILLQELESFIINYLPESCHFCHPSAQYQTVTLQVLRNVY